MARRKDHSHDELKTLVIDQVVAFLQHSPANQLSLRKLAKLVGYSAGTLINLFGSYAHLMLAANAYTLDEIAIQLNKSLKTTQQADEQLMLFAFTYFSFAQQHPYQWKILFDHHLPDEETIPKWQMQRIQNLFLLIETSLFTIAPTANKDEIQKTSRVIWAAVHGICVLETDNKLFATEAISGKQMIESLINHYLGSWQQTYLTEGKKA